MKNKPKIEVDLSKIIRFENYFQQFVRTFFYYDPDDKEKVTDKQMDVLRTTFYSGAACLNMIITTLEQMNISTEKKSEVLSSILMEIELLFIPASDMKKQ